MKNSKMLTAFIIVCSMVSIFMFTISVRATTYVQSTGTGVGAEFYDGFNMYSVIDCLSPTNAGAPTNTNAPGIKLKFGAGNTATVYSRVTVNSDASYRIVANKHVCE